MFESKATAIPTLSGSLKRAMGVEESNFPFELFGGSYAVSVAAVGANRGMEEVSGGINFSRANLGELPPALEGVAPTIAIAKSQSQDEGFSRSLRG